MRRRSSPRGTAGLCPSPRQVQVAAEVTRGIWTVRQVPSVCLHGASLGDIGPGDRSARMAQQRRRLPKRKGPLESWSLARRIEGGCTVAQPAGTIFVLRTSDVTGAVIRLVTHSRVNHAGVCLGGGGTIEARMRGAITRREHAGALYGTRLLAEMERQRPGVGAEVAAAALELLGTPYGVRRRRRARLGGPGVAPAVAGAGRGSPARSGLLPARRPGVPERGSALVHRRADGGPG